MSTISQSLSNANLQSTLTLYKLVNASVTDPTSNIVLGPYSILQAMALVDLCALDTTRDEIRNAFGWNASDLTNNKLHSSWKSLLGAMQTSASKGYQMKSANRIYCSLPLVDGFTAKANDFYGADAQTVSFADPESVRVPINEWVSEVTQKLIPECLPQGILTPDTVTVLVNACFFKGQWASMFDKSLTRPLPFQRLSGGEVRVPMMTQKAKHLFFYDAKRKASVVQVKYVGSVHMLIVVPQDADGIKSIESQLTADVLQSYSRSLKETEINLTMPLFKSRYSCDLIGLLKTMGIEMALKDTANFKALSPVDGVYLSNVMHEAFIETDEEGTKAAAATAAVMKLRCAPAPIPHILCDRPFLYFVQESTTGTVMFVGKVSDPSKE
eukprot:PhF_6_TR25504/c2_g3_i4/m.35561/K13963/SERPINB; serpin B